MNHSMKQVFFIVICFCLTLPRLAFSQDVNEASEPIVEGAEVIDLLEGATLDAWKVPSDHWGLEEGSIIGNTGEVALDTPEWIYTKQRFGDFEFTCELRLTGDNRRNTGIYFRANTFSFKGYKSFKAPSGYEFDAAFHIEGKRNFRGSLGDWYARPSLRILPDQNIINKVYRTDDWNRMTIRARGNRLEYWINGIKIMDYIDKDPKGFRKGIIGFQIHDGSVMKVEYRNIRVLSIEP